MVQANQTMLDSESLLKYFLGTDDEIDTLITCRSDVQLSTTDKALYEALGSIKEYDNFKLARLIKLLEVTDIISYRMGSGREKGILTHEQVEHLRKTALKTNREG